jgi:hypothetical protein
MLDDCIDCRIGTQVGGPGPDDRADFRCVLKKRLQVFESIDGNSIAPL